MTLQQQIAIYIQQYGRKVVEQMLHKELVNIKFQQLLERVRKA